MIAEPAQPKIDHGMELLERLQSYLNGQGILPATGSGWLLTRLQEPKYPFGTIDLLGSQPVRGQGYYSETHQLVFGVWYRPPAGVKPSLRPASDLALAMVQALNSAILSSNGFEVTQLVCGQSTPQNPDGLTHGRQVIATSITHEVNHG